MFEEQYQTQVEEQRQAQLDVVANTEAYAQQTDQGPTLQAQQSLGAGVIKVSSMAVPVLTANDIYNPAAADAVDNHARSQEVFEAILRNRGIIVSVCTPFVSELEEPHNDAACHYDSVQDDDDPEHMDRARAGFTKMMFARLKQRGIHGIRTFRMMLQATDVRMNGMCCGRTFEGALSHMGIRLKHSEYGQLLSLFLVDTADVDSAEEMVNYVQFLAYGCSNWSYQREEVVKEAFEFLRELCPGTELLLEAIQFKFRSQALTEELVPDLVHHECAQEFLKHWSESARAADGVLSWLDFLDYYLDVSWSIESDRVFCQYVCKSWGIDMDDLLAKKVFRQFAVGEDENSLNHRQFLAMLDDLDPSITDEEALAWYDAIDEDDSGEVSLEEFLTSKVLKVKRLFDHYDTNNTRTADRNMMADILRSLNPAITYDEAMGLYDYADLDGNGDLSFCEFLENNLLKLLQIFDDFNKRGTRCFNEAEMKILLRKLDPYLDDYEIHQIYKAIDVDGGGTISFLEFCESQVLRAKTLFDRYDTDRSRALTQFKFRELMLDMDNELTSSQMEAIYTLVADQNTGKVHLGGFLNPNIVKLKLLFDKYDQDRSRYMDAEELRCMLEDLYKGTCEKDIIILQATICPPEEEGGISFTLYIQRFKDLARKYELMQLARRRETRRKAQSKGLVLKEDA